MTATEAQQTTTLPVEHLFTVTVQTDPAPTFIANAPQGTRLVVRATGGTFEGGRLNGTVLPGGGDWVTMRADGSMKLDVRITLQTDDGAAILMTYSGIGLDGGARLRTAPLFETGDERYAWLNDVQAVSHGAVVEGGVRYDVYSLS
jgi:hypothetical protein